MSKAALIAEMEAIAARSAARPTADPRSIDEIIGYDDFGMPR
jgi:antitoxin VapB